MTDAQLSLLLSSLLDDLERVVEEVREQMPEDAERETRQEWTVSAGHTYVSAAIGVEDARTYYTVTGEYLALQPLLSWIEKWRERVKVLSGEAE